jgi:hypothetical protein
MSYGFKISFVFERVFGFPVTDGVLNHGNPYGIHKENRCCHQ